MGILFFECRWTLSGQGQPFTAQDYDSGGLDTGKFIPPPRPILS